MRRATAALALAFIGHASSALGQTAPSPPAPRYELFPDFDFHLSASLLATDDPRYDWDADFGGEVDVIDYGLGRANFTANYNVGLGNELRKFDPNQSNYVLELSVSRRLKHVEVHGRFHHTSRHLSDRPKTAAIDWNAVGVRATREEAWHGVRLKEASSLERVIKRSFVDYTWLFAAEASARFVQHTKMSPIGLVTPVGAARLVIRGADASVAGRGAQVGVYAEGGARFDGRDAAMEFFAAVERRIDASPLQRDAARWVLFGFRVVSRD